MLLELTNLVAVELDLDRIIAQILQCAYKMIDAHRVSIAMVSSDRKSLVVSASRDAVGLRIPIEQGIGGYVATHTEVC